MIKKLEISIAVLGLLALSSSSYAAEVNRIYVSVIKN